MATDRLRKTSKTERAAQIELGKLLEQAAAEYQEPRTCRSQPWQRRHSMIVSLVR
jgi:hypothetical protein